MHMGHPQYMYTVRVCPSGFQTLDTLTKHIDIDITVQVILQESTNPIVLNFWVYTKVCGTLLAEDKEQKRGREI